MGATCMTLAYSLVSAELIPREKLFQRPSCLSIKISPDGERLAYVGSDKEGTTNLYVVDSHLSLEAAKKVTDFQEPEIKSFHWLPDNKTLLILKDKDGNGCFHLYSVNSESLSIKDLSSNYPNGNYKIFQVSSKESKAMIGINNRNPKFHDLYLLDANEQTLSCIYENDAFINFLFDEDLNLVIKTRLNKDSSLSFLDKNDKLLFERCSEDSFHTRFLKFNKADKSLYLIDNKNTDTTELKKIYLDKNLKETVLAHDAKSDIDDVYFEGDEPIAYSTYYAYKQWHPLNTNIKIDIDYLTSKLDSNFEIINTSSNNTKWILKNSVPHKGIAFWLYERTSKELHLLHSFQTMSILAKMHPLLIRSSDGLDLISYLTLPKEEDLGGIPKKSLPLVVIPHGGPFHARDYYEYDPFHQWLANRGYAVLSVNFRSSSGFGKKFVNAGNGQWGKKAHQDILDAIQWCIDGRIAEKEKIAIFGGSYGGYEALAGLTFSPDVLACAIAICAPSSLKTVLDNVPFYWELPSGPLSDTMRLYTKNAFIKSMGGDPDKKKDIAYLNSSSPLYYVDNIKKPFLLIHGMNDPIVVSSESDQLFEKMKDKDLPVLYLSFPDEGHGVRKLGNSMCYLAYSEWLLARVLEGDYEPITEEKLQLSSGVFKSHNISCLDLSKPLGKLIGKLKDPHTDILIKE